VARIGVTLGDPAGIGPEIVVKALAKLRKDPINLTIIGSVSILTATQMMLKSNFSLPRVIDTEEVEFEFGRVQRSAGKAALDALNQAVNLLKEGGIDALVTAPVSKQAIQLSEPGFTGHTEFLAEAFDVSDVLMIAHSPYASFAFVSAHHPLKDVAPLITTQRVLRKLELYNDFLMSLHGRNASIAVLALNPHGEEFSSGEEEEISRAVFLAREKGIDVRGPYPADTLHNYLEDVDGFLAQYHDQGMIPAKLLARGQGVNITWGLPFVRTSPLHGTAFDIAGKTEASPSSLIAAIRMADQLTRS
jgi:4-hydroxythreonine-4-phosphate dehydrogenase